MKTILFGILILSSTAFAEVKPKVVKTVPKQTPPTNTEAPPAAAPPPTDSPSHFDLIASANWSLGSAGTSSGATSSRLMNHLELSTAPGWYLGGFSLHTILSYSISGQVTSPDEVSGTNIRGTEWIVGFGASTRMEHLFLLGAVELFGKYTQGEKTIAGTESSFSSPMGVRVAAGYFLNSHWSLDYSARWTQYSKNNVAGTESDISTNPMRFLWFVGIGASYHL